jgi:hypothetical protein
METRPMTEKTHNAKGQPVAPDTRTHEKAPDNYPGPDSDYDTFDFGSPIHVDFKKIGDWIGGAYLGIQTITNPNPKKGQDESFTQAVFDSGNGEFCACYLTFQLTGMLNRIPTGVRVRVTYTHDQDVNKPAPMKCFRLDIHKEDKPKALKWQAENQVGGDLPF